MLQADDSINKLSPCNGNSYAHCGSIVPLALSRTQVQRSHHRAQSFGKTAPLHTWDVTTIQGHRKDSSITNSREGATGRLAGRHTVDQTRPPAKTFLRTSALGSAQARFVRFTSGRTIRLIQPTSNEAKARGLIGSLARFISPAVSLTVRAGSL